jgi:hypothetical protein
VAKPSETVSDNSLRVMTNADPDLRQSFKKSRRLLVVIDFGRENALIDGNCVRHILRAIETRRHAYVLTWVKTAA